MRRLSFVGSGGAILTMHEDDPPPARSTWDPDVRKGILPHEPTVRRKNLKELPQEGAWREFVWGRS